MQFKGTQGELFKKCTTLQQTHAYMECGNSTLSLHYRTKIYVFRLQQWEIKAILVSLTGIWVLFWEHWELYAMSYCNNISNDEKEIFLWYKIVIIILMSSTFQTNRKRLETTNLKKCLRLIFYDVTHTNTVKVLSTWLARDDMIDCDDVWCGYIMSVLICVKPCDAATAAAAAAEHETTGCFTSTDIKASEARLRRPPSLRLPKISLWKKMKFNIFDHQVFKIIILIRKKIILVQVQK